MDFREMEYFSVIAKTQNLTRAAEILYVGQPTLSKFLQRMNSQWGIPLYEINGKKIHLTYAGQVYLKYVERLLNIRHDLDQEMGDIKKEESGMIRIGMPPVRCSFVLPAVLPRFRERYPNVDLRITEDSSAQLDQLLLQGEIDLAFYMLSMPRKDLQYECLYEDRMYLVTSKNHPIVKKAVPAAKEEPSGENSHLFLNTQEKEISLSWLSEETFLLQNRKQRQGEYILKMLSENRIVPKQVQVHSNIRAAISLASSGYGITFVSGSLMRALRSSCDFEAFRIREAKDRLQYTAACRSNSYIPGYAREFIRLVKEEELKTASAPSAQH